MTLTARQACDCLAAARAKGIDPSLEPVRAMLDELGSPDECYQTIQIVGTNGKTSTARYLASILRGEGLVVGLYLSPCLVDYIDQIEVDGEVVEEGEFAHAVEDAVAAGKAVNDARAARGEAPFANTEFDLLTVAVLRLFALRGVDIAVLEAGMGGRWDATSAASSIVEVGATGVGLDHMRMLGNTPAKIAAQKAEVVRRGRKCVLGSGVCEDESVRDVFYDRCAEQQVIPVQVLPSSAMVEEGQTRTATFDVEETPKQLGGPLGLCVKTERTRYGGLEAPKPAYQAPNIACAVVLAEEYLGRELLQDALASSIATCRTPGRFDIVQREPVVLVDACHNPQSVRAFLSSLDDIEPCVEKRPTLLCAIFADKDVAGMVNLLANAFPRVVVTRTSSERVMDPHDLAEVFRGCGLEPAGVYDCVANAVDALRGESFVACGSITTAGEVTHLLRYASKGDDDVRA